MVTCLSCAAEAPEGSAFCPSCGKRVSDDTVIGGSGSSSSSVDRGDFAAGTVLAGRYRIVALAGRGGMGEVYEADDLTLGQVVALKFLPQSLAENERALHHLLEEVRIARRISHVNVTRVHDIGEVAGRRFLTMEYVRGEDLRQLLKRIGRLPSEKALEIAHQICAGLAAAHDEGILHRDLKPANVMLDLEGKVHLTDFGLAILAKDHEGEIAGTPAYMAPEQIRGHTLTVRSEVYALGVLLFELFTGKPAFDGKTFDDFVRLHQEETPPNPSSEVFDIDPQVERVILQCLEKDPMRRPGSVRAVTGNLPGGDPLAAAIAAGQTPAPEIVAAAGSPDLLRPGVLMGVFGLCVAGLLAAVLLSSAANLFTLMGVEKSPPVLAERTRELAESLGYGDAAHRASWFESPWSTSGTTREVNLAFQYRQSPRPLAYLGPFLTQYDPAPTTPGMVSLTLDHEGRLRRFSAVPEPDLEASPGEFDWTLLLTEAGLEPADLTEIDPRAPPVFAETRMAWRGPDPLFDRVVRIDAAASGQRPVYFEMTPESAVAIDVEEVWSAFTTLLLPVFFGLQLVAVLMAWRNVRLGRGDRRGALRLAVLVFFTSWLGRLFAMRHIPDPSGEFLQLLVSTAVSLYFAVIVWFLYLAFEPYVRRKWPRALIPWTRLLAGRANDPLVGRDFLAGVLWALSITCMGAVVRFFPVWFGTGSRSFSLRDPVLLNLRQAIGAVLQTPSLGLMYALALLMAMVFLRRLAGRYAPVVWFMLLAAFMTILSSTINPSHPNLAHHGFYALVFSGSLLFVLVRFGLLAVAVGMIVGSIFWQLPLNADPGSWYFHNAILTALVVLGVSGWGLRAALAGRPVFRDELG